MIKTIYSIFDKKNISYSQFYVTDNEVNLKRVLSWLCSSGNEANFLFTNTEDFTLVKIGEIDDTTGVITAKAPEIVCELLQLKKGNENGKEES